MKTLYTIILVICLASASIAEEQKNMFISKDLGVSIETPVEKSSEAINYQLAIFFLPVSDGFSANVNIQKQKHSESIEAYDKLSMSQFKSLNWSVIGHKVEGQGVMYEYRGDAQGRALHWYSRVIKKGAHVFLVTATALDSHWEKKKAELIKSVNSFKVTK